MNARHLTCEQDFKWEPAQNGSTWSCTKKVMLPTWTVYELIKPRPDEPAYQTPVRHVGNKAAAEAYITAANEGRRPFDEVWSMLRDTPVDDSDCIDEPFLKFEAGTHREEIWHWLEETYDVRIGPIMCGETPIPTNLPKAKQCPINLKKKKRPQPTKPGRG